MGESGFEDLDIYLIGAGFDGLSCSQVQYLRSRKHFCIFNTTLLLC